MPLIHEGETVEIKGSGIKPYQLRNLKGVLSCTCPAWRNQSTPIEARTCKHLRAYLGDAAESRRTGQPVGQPRVLASRSSGASIESIETTKPASVASRASPSKGPALLLAHPWDHLTDLSGWWMSEKLDGVRGYWNGERFISREGNELHAPRWFVADLPKQPLDGELWMARQMFQRTVSIVRRHDSGEAWNQIRYLVFDAPGLSDPFEERQRKLRDWFGDGMPYAMVLEQQTCRGTEHLQQELRRVIAGGGEGLMLRQPGSRYEIGRSTTLFKVKSFLDAEARVVAHLPGKGKHAGRLGALEVEMPNGIRFSIGTGLSDAEREDPPPLGAVVTYRYQELTDRGVPRFPSFLRVRADAGL